MMHPQPSVVSLREMLEVNGRKFADVLMGLKRAQAILEHSSSADALGEVIDGSTPEMIVAHMDEIIEAANSLKAQLTAVSAARIKFAVAPGSHYTWRQFKAGLDDVESRLKDELDLLRFFALDQNEIGLLASGRELVGEETALAFPSVLFEMEESAKCLALARPTASAFHAMRALEVAVRALARYLDIDDPMKPAERNWGVVLRQIKGRIDEKYSSASRMSGEGAEIESLYASLDAVKNPWRNATMHVETIYQPHEATQIIQAANLFLSRLAKICDEDGVPIADLQTSLLAGMLAFRSEQH